MAFLNWFRDNWFTLLQTLGIAGGLFFTGFSIRTDAKARRVGNLFAIIKQHREIWSTLYSRPDLKRVLDAGADLTAKPISDEEELFVNFLIFHLESSYCAAKAGMFVLPAELRADISAFFSLPIPQTVWERAKRYHDRDFVAFVENYRTTHFNSSA